MRGWRRHFISTRQVTRTTWKVRVAAILFVALAVMATRRLWEAEIVQSLQCVDDVTASDVIVVENFDPHYLVFERAAALEKAGIAPMVLVPVRAAPPPPWMLNHVAKGFAEVMARQARLDRWEIIPVKEIEPISLNAATQIRDELARRRMKSVTVVTPGLRSRRSSLVNQAVLGGAGMRVHCAPVFGDASSSRWTDTWHGIQNVGEEFLKLQYYRFYVLPFKARTRA